MRHRRRQRIARVARSGTIQTNNSKPIGRLVRAQTHKQTPTHTCRSETNEERKKKKNGNIYGLNDED